MSEFKNTNATATESAYSAVIEYSSRPLSGKEKVKMKDTTNALSLDTLTQPREVKDENGNTVTTEPVTVVIVPDFYVVLQIHNEKSKDKDYRKYIIVDTDGKKYITGSETFMRTFKDILSDMAGEEEEYAIEVYRMPSKNYKGRDFLTCSIQ